MRIADTCGPLVGMRYVGEGRRVERCVYSRGAGGEEVAPFLVVRLHQWCRIEVVS